ncbi:MAG: hypothetical protein R3Y68_02225 [Rikenellaceae bacterium]
MEMNEKLNAKLAELEAKFGSNDFPKFYAPDGCDCCKGYNTHPSEEWE